jgi:hypothetical protein
MKSYRIPWTYFLPVLMLAISMGRVSTAITPTITILGGGYTGTCTNQTYGLSAKLHLLVHKGPDGGLSGSLNILGELTGGGPITGIIEGDDLSFSTSGSFGAIYWSGRIRGKAISGSYWIESPDGSTQQGIWSASKR